MKKTKRQMPPKFAALVEQRRMEGATTRSLLKAIVEKSDQPLSAAEVRFRFNKATGKNIDIPRVNMYLNLLVKAKQLSSRVETEQERTTRADGKPVRGMLARLYSAGSSVPKRTKTLDDIILGDGKATPESQRKASKRWHEKSRTQPAGQYILTEVERVVSERNELRARVAQLESILKQAQQVVKS